MAYSHAFVFGAQPTYVAEGVYEALTSAWEALGGAERQAIIVCICALVVFYFVVRRARRLGEVKEDVEKEESEEQIHLLEAVQARACENEVLHEKLQTQVYRGRLLRKEMRWLKECLRVTQEGLQELRNEHEELRAALTDSGGSERNSGPEGDTESRPASSRNTSRGSNRPICPLHNVVLHCPFHKPATPTQDACAARNTPPRTADVSGSPVASPLASPLASPMPSPMPSPPPSPQPSADHRPQGPPSHGASPAASRADGRTIPQIPSSLQPLLRGTPTHGPRTTRRQPASEPLSPATSTTRQSKQGTADDISADSALPTSGYESAVPAKGPRCDGIPDSGYCCRAQKAKERERLTPDGAIRHRPTAELLTCYY